VTIIAATNAPPINSDTFLRNRIKTGRSSPDPDARINDAIDHVGRHIHHDISQREREHAPFDQRIIARADRRDQ
jgi:hypothetical protein